MFGLKKKQETISITDVPLDLPYSPEYTPDLGWLEQFEYQLLFCPDETQRNMPEYQKIASDSAFIANVYTQKNYDFWEQRVGNNRMGIPLPASDTVVGTLFPPPSKIKGELHAMKPSAFIDLDDYKQNTKMFTRRRIIVLLPYRPLLTRNVSLREAGKELPLALQGEKIMLGTERVYLIRAWMYLGKKDYWDDLLDAGWSGFKPVKKFQSRRQWLGEYAYLTKHEFKD
jgi:hypothetical protein